MAGRDDRAASERATLRIRAVAASVRAPQSLRAAVAQERLAGARQRRRPARPFVLAGAGAALALVLVVLVVAGPGGGPGGSVADAAQVALRAPTDAPPDSAPGGGYLRLQVGGVTFPDYARAQGWRALGTRRDSVAGQAAATVTYGRGAQRVGYTIVDGKPLNVPSGARRVSYEGLDVAVMRTGDARYITWERGGRTCVLATRGTTLARLLDFAAGR